MTPASVFCSKENLLSLLNFIIELQSGWDWVGSLEITWSNAPDQALSPERLWRLHPWRYSKPHGMGSWANCCSDHLHINKHFHIFSWSFLYFKMLLALSRYHWEESGSFLYWRSDWSEEGIEYFALFCVLCHQFPVPLRSSPTISLDFVLLLSYL